jgi:hypothetical protein
MTEPGYAKWSVKKGMHIVRYKACVIDVGYSIRANPETIGGARTDVSTSQLKLRRKAQNNPQDHVLFGRPG